jgi:hypothetical protein
MSLAVGILRGSYPSRGRKDSKTIGLKYAKSTNDDALSPKVFENASTEIPNRNPKVIRPNTLVSNGRIIKNKGNIKI